MEEHACTHFHLTSAGNMYPLRRLCTTYRDVTDVSDTAPEGKKTVKSFAVFANRLQQWYLLGIKFYLVDDDPRPG
jgi:hypothetical protein